MRVVTFRAAPRSLPRMLPYGACNGFWVAPHPRKLVLVKLPPFPIPPPLERRFFDIPRMLLRSSLLKRPRVEEGREAPPVGARGCISEVMSRLRSFLLSGVLNNRLHRRTPRLHRHGDQPRAECIVVGALPTYSLGSPGVRVLGSSVHAFIIYRQHAIITPDPKTPTQGEQDSHLLIIPLNEKTKVVAVNINPQKLMRATHGQIACQLR